MQYKVGDNVVHLTHGLGQVVALQKKEFGGETRLYYEVATAKNTVWVPVDTTTTGTLRSITAKTELNHYAQVLKSQPVTLNADRRIRQTEITERLKSGTFQVLCEVVRDLTALGWRKPLSESDSALLRRAYDSLCSEWAKAAGISEIEASHQISALSHEAKQAYFTH